MVFTISLFAIWDEKIGGTKVHETLTYGEIWKHFMFLVFFSLLDKKDTAFFVLPACGVREEILSVFF